MKKRKLLVILSVTMLLVTVFVLASCSAQTVDLDDYIGNDNGASKLSWMGKIVKWLHGLIKNYGVTVIVFTLFVKIITLPIEFWQRLASRKMALKQQDMQPVMEALEKRYAKDPQRLNMEKQKYMRKQGLSMMGMCLPMIVTILVFFFMFGGLTNYATYNTVVNYNDLQNFYFEQYEKALDDENVYLKAYNLALSQGKTEKQAEFEATAKCVEVASKGDSALGYQSIADYYKENVQESFLWIINVWQPDTWASSMPTYSEFTRTVDLSKELDPEVTYNLIREQVLTVNTRNSNGNWNGLMILPIMTVGLTFLSMWLTQRMERKNRKGEVVEVNTQQAVTNKTMMFVMPLMMAIFGFMYTGALAIYMVMSSIFNILSTLVLKGAINKLVDKSLQKQEAKSNTTKANYKR